MCLVKTVTRLRSNRGYSEVNIMYSVQGLYKNCTHVHTILQAYTMHPWEGLIKNNYTLLTACRHNILIHHIFHTTTQQLKYKNNQGTETERA